MDAAGAGRHSPPLYSGLNVVQSETSPSRWAELRRDLRAQWWAHPLIATTLVIAMGEPGRSWSRTAIHFTGSLVLSMCIGVVTTSMYALLWGVGPKSTVSRMLVHVVSIGVGVLVGTEIALALLRSTSIFGLGIDGVRADIWRIALVVTTIVAIGSVTYDRLRQRARDVELREQRTREALLEARMEALRSQVNPHFLFNALNTVASLAEEDPPAAVEAVERLSELLRYSLDVPSDGLVPSSREVGAVRAYLSLEALRYQGRLRARVDVEPEAMRRLVPPFVLQPLVENAVKHGVSKRSDGGSVRVQGWVEGETLKLRVENDAPREPSTSGTGIGHENLRARLRLLFGDRAKFDAGHVDAERYRVELTLPVQAGPRVRSVESGAVQC